jgi:hypothetical protein
VVRQGRQKRPHPRRGKVIGRLCDTPGCCAPSRKPLPRRDSRDIEAAQPPHPGPSLGQRPRQVPVARQLQHLQGAQGTVGRRQRAGHRVEAEVHHLQVNQGWGSGEGRGKGEVASVTGVTGRRGSGGPLTPKRGPLCPSCNAQMDARRT